MKVYTEFQQNSLEWLVARAGVVTASEFKNLITPTWKPRTGDGVETYIARKVAESWLRGPLPGGSSLDMEMGHILEEEAIPAFEFEHETKIERVAFITDDDGRVGCSPDGLIGEDGGIEIKCPAPHTHVSYLLDGQVPPEYIAQVHGSMYVTGRKWWYFMSYRRNFPTLLIKVERDLKIVAAISDAVGDCLDRIDEALTKLVKRNGGTPEAWSRPKFAPAPQPEPEPIDVIP